MPDKLKNLITVVPLSTTNSIFSTSAVHSILSIHLTSKTFRWTVISELHVFNITCVNASTCPLARHTVSEGLRDAIGANPFITHWVVWQLTTAVNIYKQSLMYNMMPGQRQDKRG